MPMKPFERLSPPRRSRPITRRMARSKTSAAVRDERNKNLEKARRVRKKNLAAKKQLAKK